MSNHNLVTAWFTIRELNELSKYLKAGDRLEFIFPKTYNPFYHWALCVEGGHQPVVIHFTSGSNSSSSSGFGNCNLIKERLTDIMDSDDKVRINNEDDADYKPRPVDEIVANAVALAATATRKNTFNTVKNNCEHFVNQCRYGNAFSHQLNDVRQGVKMASIGIGTGLTLLRLSPMNPYVALIGIGLIACTSLLRGFRAFLDMNK